MKLKFARREYKYYLADFLVSEFLNFFAKRMKLDEHNLGLKPYIVRSLYFDSPDLRFYKEKIRGEPFRKKVRLRTYTDKPQKSELVFLEIKNKFLDKIYKERFPINERQRDFFNDKKFSDLLNYKNGIVEECFLDQKSYSLSPKVLVYFKRIAFWDNKIGFKVNLDFDLRAVSSENLWEDTQLMISLLKNVNIVELKFDGIIPICFQNFVMEHNLERVPFSKYCTAIEVLQEKRGGGKIEER